MINKLFLQIKTVVNEVRVDIPVEKIVKKERIVENPVEIEKIVEQERVVYKVTNKIRFEASDFSEGLSNISAGSCCLSGSHGISGSTRFLFQQTYLLHWFSCFDSCVL